MRIGVVSLHGCIRAHKQAMQLANTGHDVHFVASYISSTHSSNGYSTVNIFDTGMRGNTVNTEQLAHTVKLLDNEIDVWHVHNEPNWIFTVVKQNSKKPVVFDIHDWTSLRRATDPLGQELEHEEFALKNADAFVVPSQGYLTKIRESSKKPSILIYSKVPSWLYPPEATVKKPGLVYEGGLMGNYENMPYNFRYRNWSEFIMSFVDDLPEEQNVYLYSANPIDDPKAYDHPKIKLSNPLIYPDLLQKMSEHSVGLVGSPLELLEFKDAMPNKLFEYISSGIPVIIVNAPEAQKYVEQYRLGIGVRDASEVPEALEKLTSHSVLRDRWAHSIDGEMPLLTRLYEELCGRVQRDISQMVSGKPVTSAGLNSAGSN